MGGDGEGVVSR